MKDLLTAITTTLKTVTPKVYYLHLPDDSYLNDITITYRLNNTFNDSVIEHPELTKTYDCIVTINSPKTTNNTISNDSLGKILPLYNPVKQAMYKLPVGFIKCLNEDTDFDPFRETYYISFRFEIKN